MKDMPESSVRRIIGMKDDLKKKATTVVATNVSSRKRSRIMDKMEHLLAIWIESLHKRNIPVGLTHIRTKALLLFQYIQKNLKDKTIEESKETFTASSGL